ncbi:hypothetical protein C1646_764294 [Rhizophagus diaphanus]|nr:hypothetical protein C1646_764294 [Rhizophagus diaphanus] [Rhizophagus sp. MUCL 43196]
MTFTESNRPTLPSKWLEIEVSSLDDILAEVHYYVGKLIGDEKIIHLDYLDITNSDKETENENIKLHKKKNAIPKLDDFSTILQQEGRIICDLREQYKCDQYCDTSCFVSDAQHVKLIAMHLQCWAKEIPPDFLIFSQTGSIKGNPKTSTPMMISNSNSNTMPFFFTISSQMIAFIQNSITNDVQNLQSNVLPPSKQPIPSLDEFFTKLDELDIGKFTRFKNNFESE